MTLPAENRPANLPRRNMPDSKKGGGARSNHQDSRLRDQLGLIALRRCWPQRRGSNWSAQPSDDLCGRRMRSGLRTGYGQEPSYRENAVSGHSMSLTIYVRCRAIRLDFPHRDAAAVSGGDLGQISVVGQRSPNATPR